MHSLFIHSIKIKKYIEVVAKEAGQNWISEKNVVGVPQ